MRVLVAYETNAGSTEEVARTIADTLTSAEVEVEVKRLSEIEDMGIYAAAVIGAPMIVGWHRKASRFVRRQQKHLSRIPVAYFMTALKLTDGDPNSLEGIEGIDLYRDAALLKKPGNPDRLSFRERRNSLETYLKPVLKKAPAVRPVSIGLFAGKLDYRKLRFLQMVFVMLLFAEKPRDYRNWEHINSWAEDLRRKLLEKTSGRSSGRWYAE